jgi:hypothetical protein
MKKTTLVLALVAGLTSFAGNVKAAIITQNLNQTANLSNGWISFGYIPSSQTITTTASAASISAAFGTPSTIGYSGGPGYTGWQGVTFGQEVNASNTTGGGHGGNGPATTSGYLGVRFNETNGLTTPVYYGWVNFIVDANSISFGQAAVETIANTPIIAGQTAAVPEASQVAASVLLLVGISGFVIMKRKKAVSA